MAKFTLIDDKTDVSTAKMHVNGRKRLHLAGVGGDRKVLNLQSTKPAIVSARIVALFNGPKGIWTVDIEAKATGKSELNATVNNAVVATLAVTVEENILLPAATTEPGLLARLFLAESRTPSESGYNATDAKTGMQWMRVVVENRLKNNPQQFNADGATKILDIVKAPGQFHGFESYPNLSAAQQARIDEIVAIANNDNDSRQEKFSEFLSNALTVQ